MISYLKITNPFKIFVDSIEIKNNFEYSKGSDVANLFKPYGAESIETIKISFLGNEISGIITNNSGTILRYKVEGEFSYAEDSVVSASLDKIGMTTGA